MLIGWKNGRTGEGSEHEQKQQQKMGKHLLLVSLYHKLIRTIQSLKKKVSSTLPVVQHILNTASWWQSAATDEDENHHPDKHKKLHSKKENQENKLFNCSLTQISKQAITWQ